MKFVCAYILPAFLSMAMLSLSTPTQADSQWPVEPIFLGTEEGLPQNSVRSLLADHENYLWVGTELGLARFDGHRFIDFSQLLPDLPVDVLFEMYEDSQGRIWTFWYNHNPRILLADRRTVIEVEPAPGLPDDLKNRYPRPQEDDAGDLWFSGHQAVYRFGVDGSVAHVVTDSRLTPGLIIVGNRILTGTDRGLIQLQRDELSAPPQLISLPQRNSPTGNISAHIYWVENRLLACNTQGVFEIDLRSREAALIFEAPDASLVSCFPVRSSLVITLHQASSKPRELMTIDVKNRTTRPHWTGLPTEGLFESTFTDSGGGQWLAVTNRAYYLAPDAEAFVSVPMIAPLFGNLSPMLETHDGVIWIGTDGRGLARFSRYARKFNTVIPGGDMLDRNSRQVRRMGVDKNDNVWVGTEERGLFYWDRESDQWKNYIRDLNHPVKDLAILRDGSVFAAIPNLFKVVQFRPDQDTFEDVLTGLSSNVTVARSHDGSKLVFSGGSDGFIGEYDPASAHVRKLNDGSALIENEAQVRALTIDADGRPWLGTHGHGVGRVDGLEQVTFWHTGNSALTSDQIFALKFDAAGILWIGTWHGGLWSLDPATNELTHYGSERGLPLTTIFGILIDEDGYLWLSSYQGLARYKPCEAWPGCEDDITVFNQHDGLQALEFDAEAAYQSERGEFFFGGIGGFNAFFPGQIESNTRIPDVRVTRLLHNGEDVTAAVDTQTALDFPNEFGELRIEISALDYSAPQKSRFQYRNLGAESEWRNLGEASLTIHDWPDGRHQLLFRGTNNDGVWSPPSAVLKFNIEPPFFRKPALLVLYAAILLLIPSIYFRWRQSSLMRQRQDLEQRVAERTDELEQALSGRERFFANISHEISAPLHMILLMLENNLEEDMPNRKALYRSATGYAAQLMVYLRQLVTDARQREIDRTRYAMRPKELITQLVEINLPVAQARHIDIEIDEMPEGTVAMNVSSATSVFSNLLCNALVYTPEHGKVRIRGELRQGVYRVTFENPTDLSQEVDMDDLLQRGTRGNFDPNTIGGHGLGLSIVTDTLKRLGGQLDRLIRDDGWVVFHVDLPLCTDELPPMPTPPDFRFSHEQQLAIELIHTRDELEPPSSRMQGRTRVLIIEDDDNVANLMSIALQRDYNVMTRSSCAEGIRAALTSLPDIVLCDLFLPDALGFEAVKAIRGNRMTMDALIIMITASISEKDRSTGVSVGVDQFVTKPVPAETLRLMIETHMELNRQRKDNQRQIQLRERASKHPRELAAENFTSAWPGALEDLFADPATTVEDFQTRLLMSYGQLVKNCKKHYGRTPRKLLIERRIKEARQLLEQGNTRIGVISELSGFASHPQFAVTFKKETGQSPAQYRAAHQATQG